MVSMKTCITCHQEKALSEFYKHRSYRDGVQNNCKRCHGDKAKAHYRKNPGLKYEHTRRNKLKTKYGITLEQVEWMLETQEHQCKICKRELVLNGEGRGRDNNPYVDHDHITGKVRGLLCRDCNIGLGAFHDSTEFLQNAIEYLQESLVT